VTLVALRRAVPSAALTRQFALHPAEWATSAVATVVSTRAYLRHGQAYLAPGVAGDLVGFAVLSAVAAHRGARVRHEALLCLGCIGAVVAGTSHRRFDVDEPVLWAAFALGLAGYVRLRQRMCE
jgi:hypothetical protein